MKARLLWMCALGPLALTTLACGDDENENRGVPDAGMDAGTGPGMVSYTQDIQPVWNAYCVGCHNSASPQGGLNLEAGASYAQLVNVPTECDPTLNRVVPNDLQASMLWRMLANRPDKCDGAMPLGSPGLIVVDPPAHLRVESWINQGAPNN